jgi:imidazolonepropionase-like amidohydrolase
MYGFGMLRNLELHQEAGFHPLRVLRHATVNGARVLRAENTIGRVRAGWSADLLIVNGNPLEDFKVLYRRSRPTPAPAPASNGPSGQVSRTTSPGFCPK